MTPHTRPTRLLVAFVTLLVPTIAVAWQGSPTLTDERILAAIGAREGMTVCEMGAGDGELSIAAAKLVGPGGRVYTSELGDDRVKTLREKTSASGHSQISVVTGDPSRTNFPEGSCDALFMRNVYHHFADPAKMDASIFASVKPGGRVVVVDFTPPKEAEQPEDRGKDGMHGVMPDTVTRELKNAGFEPVSSDAAQRWFIVVAARPKS